MINVMEKIKKLHTKAESCKEIGSREEAEAFAAMVNRLLLQHNLELTDLQWEEEKQNDPIEEVRVEGITYKRQRQAWAEMLASIIARAHFCEILVVPGTNIIILVGHRQNRQVAD